MAFHRTPRTIDGVRADLTDRLRTIGGHDTGFFSGDCARVASFRLDEGAFGFFAVVETPSERLPACGWLRTSGSLDQAAERALDLALRSGADCRFGVLYDPTLRARPPRRKMSDEIRTLIADFVRTVDMVALRADRYMLPGAFEQENQPAPDYGTFRTAPEPFRTLLADWPWMTYQALLPTPVPTSPGEPPLDYAVRVFRGFWNRLHVPSGLPDDPGLDPRLARVLDRIRGLWPADTLADEGAWRGVVALAEMPPEWLPPPLDGATSGEWDAALEIGEATYRFARNTGRDRRSLLKTFPGSWRELKRDIVAAAAVPDHEVAPFRTFAHHAADMLLAFNRQVMKPALARSGRDVAEVLGPGSPLRGRPDHAFSPMSAKLIIRDKGWKSVAELVRKWSATSGRIGIAEARLMGGETSWKVPFRTVVVGDAKARIEIEALADAQALIDEGSAGTNADGMAGLDHCVASYLDQCASGDSLILSFRSVSADGTKRRTSTAEIAQGTGGDLDVVQHRGRANGEPPEADVAALRDLLRERSHAILAWFAEAERDGRSVTKLEPDAPDVFETMRQAWEFALPRDLRRAGPDELVGRALGRPRTTSDGNQDRR